MALKPWKALPLSPPPVAVHDDGEVVDLILHE
jgi:hypothetical protein